MKFEVVKVTPDIAARFLMKNDGNRKLREHRAAYLARAIEEGKWKLTHQPIAIGKRGRLLDGQHRLRAICLANMPAELVVATDVPDDVFAVLDAGLPRKMHERLRSDADHTSTCTSLFRLMVGRSTAHEYEIELMLEIFAATFLKLAQVPRTRDSKFERKAIQAAISLRTAMAIKAKDDNEVIRIQWVLEKLRRGDVAGAPPIVCSFYKQTMEGVANLDIGVSQPTDQFCRAWVAFNRDNEGVSRLQITDHSLHIKEARLEFKFLTEGQFD
jgi:hypothetical protein